VYRFEHTTAPYNRKPGPEPQIVLQTHNLQLLSSNSVQLIQLR